MDVAVLRPLAVDGREVPGVRLRALLVALLLSPGRVVGTGALLEAVWGEELPAEPAAALQALVSRARRTTGVPVEHAPGGYRVPAGAVHTDLAAAEDALRRARAALATGDAAGAARRAREALALWPGSGPDQDDAAQALRPSGAARAAATHRDLLLVRSEAELALGGAPEGLADLEAAVAARPLDEPLAALLLRSLAAQGRPAEALARFEEVREALAEYGSDPSPPLRAAHAAVLRGSGTAAAAPPAPRREPAAGPGRTALLGARLVPVGVAEPLLGRADDLADLAARVQQHVLVTVVGPGGVGKTSLLTALAAQWRERGEPVHDVALAGVRAADDVLPVVLAALGGARRAEPPRAGAAVPPPEDELHRAVAGARGLLVLDNCEHLLDAVADVVLRVCAAAPAGLRVVATSRAALGVLGEQVHPLHPLADDDAGALVRRRVRAVRPDAVLDPGDLAELCRRLDGLPLALELAAARLRTTALPDLLAGLGDRSALLAAGPRGLPDRHRSLQALVDWSWDLLSPPERVLLRRLAVFPSGGSSEAVVAVCADPVLPRGTVLPGGTVLPAHAVPPALAGLVEASLVVLEPGPAGTGRYRLLETVRQYAEARGEEAEREALAERLAQEAVRLARRVSPHLHGSGQLVALAEVTADRDALVSSLRWAATGGRGDLAIALAGVLADVATLRGTHAEVLEWFRVLRSAPGVLDRGATPVERPGSPPALQWQEAAHVALLAVLSAVVAGERRTLARALIQLRTASTRPDLLGPELGEVVAAVVDLVRSDLRDPFAAAERLVAAGSPQWRAMGLLARAWARENNGLDDLGLQDARDAHAVARELGDLSLSGTAAQIVGQRLAARGDVAEALVWWREAEEAATALAADGDARQARALALRARLVAAQPGDDVRAVRAELVDLAAAHPEDHAVGLAAVALRAEEALADGDAGRARQAYRSALADGGAGAPAIPQVRAVLLAGAATVEVHAGDPAAAAPLLRRAADAAEASRDVPAQAAVGDAVALWCAASGDASTARRLWAVAERFGSHLHSLLGAAVPGGLLAVLGDDPAATPEAAEVAALDGPEAVALLQRLLGQALRR